MARIPHGLLLSFEGLASTVFQSQVLSTAAWLQRQGIASFDVVSFAISPKGPQRSSAQGTIFVEAPDVVPRPYLPNTARPQWVRSPLLRSVPFHMSCLRRRRPSALS